MNNQEVYIVTDNDEIYLGTVGKITGIGGIGDLKLGQGISMAVVISDLVSKIIFDGNDSLQETFTIQLRQPGVI